MTFEDYWETISSKIGDSAKLVTKAMLEQGWNAALERCDIPTAEEFKRQFEPQIEPLAFHTYSTETIYHFNCYSCKKWWSISEFAIEIGIEISCPHCHAKARLTRI